MRRLRNREPGSRASPSRWCDGGSRNGRRWCGRDVDRSAGAALIAKSRTNEPCPCGSGKKYKNCCDALPNFESARFEIGDCFILETLPIDHANNSFATNHHVLLVAALFAGCAIHRPRSGNITPTGRSNQRLECDEEQYWKERVDERIAPNCEEKPRPAMTPGKTTGVVVQCFASKEESAI